jgi:hypothetical protein
LASEREVTHHESNITATVSDEFEHDNVLRPHTHKVRYGNGPAGAQAAPAHAQAPLLFAAPF